MRARSEAAFCGLAFAALGYALHGYVFGRSANHAFYLPYVLARLDPSLYPADLVVDALKVGSPTPFWDFLAALAGPLGLERAAFHLWWLSRAMAGAATYQAARALGGGRRAGWLAALLCCCSSALFDASPLAGDPMLKASIDQTSFAWPFVLWAATVWLGGATLGPLAGLGALAWLNPLLGGLTGAWLSVWGIFERRPGAWKGAAVFALLAAGAVLRGWRGGGDLELMLAVSSQTYLPSAWPLEKWLLAAGWALVAVFFGDKIGAGLAAALVLWLLAPRFVQPYRLDVAVIWLLLICLAAEVEHRPKAAAALGALFVLLALPRRPPPPPADPLAAAADWARSAPPDSVFVVRPETSGFRLASRRPVFAEWTDFNLALWDAPRAAEWKRRMAALGVDWDVFPRTLAAQQRRWEAGLLTRGRAEPPDAPPAWDASIRRLAGTADYLVAPQSLKLPWKAAASWPGVTIYAIPKP